jgi:hypothetical protein
MLSASACQSCKRSQRHPNKPVNARLTSEQTVSFTLNEENHKTKPIFFNRPALTGWPLAFRPHEHVTADFLHIARQLRIEDKWPKC